MRGSGVARLRIHRDLGVTPVLENVTPAGLAVASARGECQKKIKD
jgi:hypothetical protein